MFFEVEVGKPLSDEPDRSNADPARFSRITVALLPQNF
jgi:hypothetical protein